MFLTYLKIGYVPNPLPRSTPLRLVEKATIEESGDDAHSAAKDVTERLSQTLTTGPLKPHFYSCVKVLYVVGEPLRRLRLH